MKSNPERKSFKTASVECRLSLVDCFLSELSMADLAKVEIFDPHHPAVLRMISLVVENAHKAGIWAGICGELGADQSLTKEFLAMGVDELSVSPGSILPLRKIILETNVTDYKAGKEC